MSAEKELIHGKMIEIMRAIGSIGKDGKNTAQKFNFRGIDQIYDRLYPILCRVGVRVEPKMISQEVQIRENAKGSTQKHVQVEMEYSFVAEDGSSVVSARVPGEGLDYGDKATNKALASAYKYAMCHQFCIPTGDVDGDSESPEIEVKTIESKKENTPKSEIPKEAPKSGSSSFRKERAKKAKANNDEVSL